MVWNPLGFKDVFEFLGFFGGLMFPIATASQTIKVLWTRSAKDISYGWQAIFALAHCLYLVYSIHFGLWVIYTTQGTELAIMFVMIAAKLFFDFCDRSKPQAGFAGVRSMAL